MFGQSRRDRDTFSIPQFEPDGHLFINAQSPRRFYGNEAPVEAHRFADGYLLGIANAITVLLEKVTESIRSNPANWQSLKPIRSAFIAYVDEAPEHGEMPAGQAAMDAFMSIYLKRQA
jgi:hypothetical protein